MPNRNKYNNMNNQYSTVSCFCKDYANPDKVLEEDMLSIKNLTELMEQQTGVWFNEVYMEWL